MIGYTPENVAKINHIVDFVNVSISVSVVSRYSFESN